MTGDSNHVSGDDYAGLVALLDKRRRMSATHLRSKRLPGRSRLTLAEKVEIDRKHRAEMIELNRQIDALMERTKGTV
ncbi:hypothetical protein P12x_005299 [Tundrisphaera lichenicola]|uniref:hypothetical protein n=1 Tax=Tundrisphaera lichenicola TaxID=2029860 RepID=UPI003EBA94FA